MRNKIFVVLFFGSIVITSPMMIKRILPESEIIADTTLNEPILIASTPIENEIITNVVVEPSENKKIESLEIKEEIVPKVEKLQEAKKVPQVQSEVKEETNNVDELKEPEEETKEVSGENSYFEDALFIGDSRTEGIEAFGGIKNATFFANTGMSLYNLPKTKVSIGGLGKVSLDELLAQKKFGKVYILLGINELGYELEKTVKKYSELIEKVQLAQGDPIIYVQANLHVTAKKSNSSQRFSNERINQLNSMLAGLADGEKIFYIDVNEKFDDETGSLPSNYTQDGIHIYAKHYKTWTSWIEENIAV